MEKNITDEQLIHSYQKGDAKAFEVLYARYKKAIYHYFFRQVNSTGIADELHQDVWLNIIKSSSSFSQQSSFKTWLYKISHNRLIDHYRQSSKQALHLAHSSTHSMTKLEENRVEKESSSSSVETSKDQSIEPDAMLQEQQVSRAILNAIDLLPEKQKEVFLLHEKSGLKLQEIALITDSSFESTKSRLRYAVKKLRHHMTQYLAI